MDAIVECSGATRDLGLDQGRACRGGVRDAVARAGVVARRRPWRAFASRLAPDRDPAARVANDVVRHHPHQAERCEGLARGAGLPREAILALLARAPAPAVLGARLGKADDGSPCLVALLGEPRAPGSRWLLRRSAPDVGYRSVEVTLPWLVSSLAGVNESGLAAAFVPRPGARAEPGVAHAPSVLLVQDCLQRFASLDAAVDWCLKRPSAGDGTLVLLDAEGQAAAVRLGPGQRSVVPPERGEVPETDCAVAGPSARAVALRDVRASSRVARL